MCGFGFRRQYVIAKYIANFAAPGVRVAVEVDGGYHQARGRADARRDRELRQLGFVVVRLEAEFVLRDVALAVAAIRNAVAPQL